MKLTWNDVYEDFKKTYPALVKRALHYEPYGYAEIKIWLKDNLKMVYNYDTKLGRYIDE